MRIEKIKKKTKVNRENFEIDKVVKISNNLSINSDKMFADALNFIITKKHERELEDKRKDYIYKKTIANYRSL